MKKIYFIALLLFLSIGTVQASQSQSSGSWTGTGIGVVFGYPGNVGISVKIKNFPVIGVSWYLGQSAYFGGTIDYWIINNSLDSNFYWYLGVGGYVWLENSIGLGPRVPVGLQWFPGAGPIELALEAAPALSLLPGIELKIQGSFAVRFHF